MKKIILVVAGLLVVVACILEMALPIKAPFDPGNLKELTYNFNSKDRTVSVLYGNDKAFSILNDKKHVAQSGAIFKLVTSIDDQSALGLDLVSKSKLHDIETITMEASINSKLIVKYQSTKKIAEEVSKKEFITKRIAFITSLKSNLNQ